jgi:hypothetical protein
VEKYFGSGQATDDNMAHGHSMLDNQATQTLRICNIHCLFSATVVARTRFDVTLYVYCLSCVYWGLFEG